MRKRRAAPIIDDHNATSARDPESAKECLDGAGKVRIEFE